MLTIKFLHYQFLVEATIASILEPPIYQAKLSKYSVMYSLKWVIQIIHEWNILDLRWVEDNGMGWQSDNQDWARRAQLPFLLACA
jgi:hypothetical protein